MASSSHYPGGGGGGGGRRRSSNPLHNFSLPPNHLRWGNQRLLRCTKLTRSDPNSSHPTTTASTSESPVRNHHNNHQHPPLQPTEDTALVSDTDDVRENLMRDLRMAAKKMMIRTSNNSIEETGREEVSPTPEEEEAAAIAAGRPWNLRTRRAACRAPPSGGGGEGSGVCFERTVRVGSPLRRNFEREKFSVCLSRDEVELDYLVMVGTRPPRRPKKRPRIIQKQLEFVFPGSWLTEVTVDRYRVPETVDLPKS